MCNTLESIINRYYDPSTDQFLSIDPDVATTDQPYVFTNDDPLNAEDPQGLCGFCNFALDAIKDADIAISDGIVDVVTAVVPGLDETGAGEEADLWADGEITNEVEGSDEPDQTAHGEEQSTDASRLSKTQQADVINNPTETFTQKDGADVYVQEVGEKYNVVVQNETTGKVVTNFKTISQGALNRLANNYGWTPK